MKRRTQVVKMLHRIETLYGEMRFTEEEALEIHAIESALEWVVKGAEALSPLEYIFPSKVKNRKKSPA